MRAGSAVGGGGGREAAAGGGRAAATRFLSPTGAPLHGGCRGRPQITGRGPSPLLSLLPLPPPRPPPCPPGPRRPPRSPQVRDGEGAARSRRAWPRKGAGDPSELPSGDGGRRGLWGQRRPSRWPAGEGGGAGRGRAGVKPRGSPGWSRRGRSGGVRLCPAQGPAFSWGSAAPQLGERGFKDAVQEVKLSCVFGFS